MFSIILVRASKYEIFTFFKCYFLNGSLDFASALPQNKSVFHRTACWVAEKRDRNKCKIHKALAISGQPCVSVQPVPRAPALVSSPHQPWLPRCAVWHRGCFLMECKHRQDLLCQRYYFQQWQHWGKLLSGVNGGQVANPLSGIIFVKSAIPIRSRIHKDFFLLTLSFNLLSS